MLPAERQIMTDAIKDAYATHPSWNDIPPKEQQAIVRRTERSCSNATINDCKKQNINTSFENEAFLERYSNTCYRVIANISLTSSVGSTFAYDGIMNGTLPISEIGYMSSYQLCPEASEAERNIIDVKRNQKTKPKVSTAYTCKKCGKNETTFVEHQTRAADEMSTKSILCMVCGYMWSS